MAFFPSFNLHFVFFFFFSQKKKLIKYGLFHLLQIVPIYFGYFFLAMCKFKMFIGVKTIHFCLTDPSKPSRQENYPIQN